MQEQAEKFKSWKIKIWRFVGVVEDGADDGWDGGGEDGSDGEDYGGS